MNEIQEFARDSFPIAAVVGGTLGGMATGKYYLRKAIVRNPSKYLPVYKGWRLSSGILSIPTGPITGPAMNYLDYKGTKMLAQNPTKYMPMYRKGLMGLGAAGLLGLGGYYLLGHPEAVENIREGVSSGIDGISDIAQDAGNFIGDKITQVKNYFSLKDDSSKSKKLLIKRVSEKASKKSNDKSKDKNLSKSNNLDTKKN